MIKPISTTLTPMDSTDEPTARALLSIYHGDAVIASVLLSFEDAAVCDRCGEELELGVEADVDEDGARHRGDCPEPEPDVELDEAA